MSFVEQRIAVVGGGIVGLAVAREIVRRRPGAQVTVLEKEDRVGAHQTGHNSGVVHAGIYYQPGSLKAELCTRGRLLLRDYCAEHRLPYVECGKVVVAVDATETARFDALERTATANGVPGLRRLDQAALRDVEPHAAGLAALHSPRTAITDYVGVAGQIGRDVRAAGGAVRLSSPVTRITRVPGGVRVLAGAASYDVERVVLCGGLQSDRLGRLAGGDAEPRILPFRGEYLVVAPEKQDLVRGMVYPVPDPRYPFLGVHFTRRVDGSLEVGPNAVLAPHRDSYRRASLSMRDLASTAVWPGFWHMAGRHWRTGAREVRGSLSVRAYLRDARRYVPAIGVDDVRRRGFGIRAQAVERDGTLVDDFRIEHADGLTSVRNAPSPAATSSLAIAEHVVDRIPA